MSTSTISSASASSGMTVIEDFKSTCSNDDNLLAEAVGYTNERERSPYSASADQVDRINISEIVNSHPLPAEFQRERKPYASAQQPVESGAAKKVQESSQSQTPAGQPAKESGPEIPQQPQQRQQSAPALDPYRDDILPTYLPETLRDVAMTVAAQTYHAAKNVVGNLGNLVDPFAMVMTNRIHH